MVFQFLSKCKAFIRKLFIVPTEEVWDKIEDVLVQCDHVQDIEYQAEEEVINLLPIKETIVEQPILLLESPKLEIQPQIDEVLDIFPASKEIEVPEVVEEIQTEEVEQLELNFDAVSDIVSEPVKEEIAEDVKQESFDIAQIITDQISILPQIIESVSQFIESRQEEQRGEPTIDVPELGVSVGNISEDVVEEPHQSICQRIRRVRKKILRYTGAELVPIPREVQQRQVQMRSGGPTIITYPGVRNHRNGCNPNNFRTINMNGVTMAN